MAPAVLVVGAAIVDDLDLPRVLLAARRSAPKSLAGRWELPGGKVEPGEQPSDALRREVREELGVAIEFGAEIPGPAQYGAGAHGGVIGRAWPLFTRPDGSELAMRVWLARVVDGSPRPLEDHDQLRELGPGTWRDVDWLDADVPIVDALIEAAVKRHRANWC